MAFPPFLQDLNLKTGISSSLPVFAIKRDVINSYGILLGKQRLLIAVAIT